MNNRKLILMLNASYFLVLEVFRRSIIMLFPFSFILIDSVLSGHISLNIIDFSSFAFSLVMGVVCTSVFSLHFNCEDAICKYLEKRGFKRKERDSDDR